MKIIYFSYTWDLWGACIGPTIKSLELIKGLEEGQHEVKMYWLRDDFYRGAGPISNQENHSTRDILKKYFSRYLHEPSQVLKNIKSINEERKILDEEKPDLVISRLDSYVYSPARVAPKVNIPYIIEMDSPGAYEKVTFQTYYRSTAWLLNHLELKHINAGKAGFTISQELKSYFVNKGISEEFITVIPNGANPDFFSPDIPAEPIKEKYHLHDHVIIGFVGSFIFWHGVGNLITIIERVLQKSKDVKFLMVGKGGPLEPILKKFITENKLEEKVILTGYVSHRDVPPYISAMDIVLAPYPELTFFYYSPLKIFEYMSCGKAVISTRIGQVAEIIEDQLTGFLTKPNDINQIVDIISNLIVNDRLRESIGVAARKEILEKHTWQKRKEQLLALCEQYV